MINLKSMDEYVERMLLENQIVFSQRKSDADGYKQFSKDVIHRILNRENADEHYKWDFSEKFALVVNDFDLAEEIKHLGCTVLYIQMNDSEQENYIDVDSEKIDECTLKFESIVDNFLNSNKDKNKNPITSFDIVINVSIPIYSDDIPEHSYNFEKVAKINEMIFNSSVIRNRMGIDRTFYYTIDDKHTYNSFYRLINKKRDKDIIPEVIDVINKSKSNKYGFDVEDDRTLVRIFVRSLGKVRADTMDTEESNETGEKVSAKGVFVGRTNPNIYCFKTANVPGCLKVGDTFRPVGVRMEEWQNVFGDEAEGFEHNKDWEWSAVENNWVFRDYTVHEYLKDMKKERLYNRSKYSEYFKPVSPAYNIDDTYSNEFFVDTTPEDVEQAVNNIRNDIRENIDTLRDSLKRLDDDIEETGVPFYDERELQKKCIDNFTQKISGEDHAKEFLIYAVMRFGKTYTAIRCLQEFYKKNPNSHMFSIIATAKPEVKNEWIGGIEKYISDSIDETGKGGYDKDIEDNEEHKFTKRTFDNFKAYTIDELRRDVRQFFLDLKDSDPETFSQYMLETTGDYEDTTIEESRYAVESMSKKKKCYYLAEHALEKYIELGGNNGKVIVLFASSQDLAGSNKEIKLKHQFFYDCPLDMVILDETHFAVRAKSYGAPTDTRRMPKMEDYVPEEDDIPDEEKNDAEKEKEKKGIEEFNKLNITEDTIKLHLSGTPYKILKNKEFNNDNILAAFTQTHLRQEKEKWEKENLPKRVAWEEEQEKKREAGDPDAKEEWENPYSADKNPYFGIPKLTHYSYDLSKFELESIRSDTSSTTCMEELFRVRNAETKKIIKSTDYQEENAKNIPIEFVHRDDVIKLFRIIDGAKRKGEEKKILSILNIPQIKEGNMCKNILIALPFKDSCDCLAKLLQEKDPEHPGEKLFKILGEYEIINAAGRRDTTVKPINRIRGLGEKTITLTSDMLLTGVTVEPWDTLFYMKDGKSPEPYDQAKFRVQSPYINKLPIFDKSILSGAKPPVLKQDLKPQTLFVDFLPTRMLKILDEQMYNEEVITGNTSSEILKSTPVAVIAGDNIVELDAPGFSDYYSSMIEKEGGDPGYMRLIKKIRCSNPFLDDDDVMDALWEFHDYAKSGGDEEEEPTPPDESTPEGGNPPVKPPKKPGHGAKPTPKPKSVDKLREARRERFESFINGLSIYDILRKDRDTIKLARHDDMLGKLIDSVNDEKNKVIVHAVFFNNNFKVADDKCVEKVTAMLSKLKEVFKKESITMNGVEVALQRVENIMNKSESTYKKVSLMFNAAGNSRLGATEYVSDARLIKHMINSDFVIFNDGCKVLDCYGSKIGEFANYILNNDEVKRTKGIVNPENYYILCYTHLTYEMNKFVLSDMGVPEKNILFCNTIKEIEENIGKMVFSCILGNPPYKGKGNPLYMRITKSIYDNNMDNDSVMSLINPTALVDNKYMEKDDKNYERYKDLKLVDFYYNPTIRGIFTSADIGNDIAIFTYKKDGTMSIFDDDVKVIRFGEDYKRDKSIVESLKRFNKISELDDFDTLNNGDKNAVEVFLKKRNGTGKYFVVCSYIRGHIDNQTGGYRWDWTTLLNSVNFLVKKELYDISMSVASFDNREDAIKLIKWFNTDFLQYIVLYYKTQMTNNNVLFRNLPQPPKSGDYSDESICEAFGLEMSDMEYIHEKMKNYGWKTKHNEDFISDYNKAGYKLPSVKLDGTDKTLLKFIDELNRINDGVDASSYVPEDEEENEEYSETESEEESPSSSGSLPKSIYDLDPEEILDIDEDKLKEKYPEEWKGYERNTGDNDERITFNQWLKDKIEEYIDKQNDEEEDV